MKDLEMYYRAIVDCWRFFKKYRVPQEAQEYWREVVDEANRIYVRNQKSYFVKQIILAMLDEINRLYKEQSKKR